MGDEKADMTDAEPPLVAQWRTFGMDTNDDTIDTAADTDEPNFTDEHATSPLGLLALAAHETEFMPSVAQLFMQFVAQYRTLTAQQAASAAANTRQLAARAAAVRQWAEKTVRASRNGVTTLDKTVVDLIARRTARAEEELAAQHHRDARTLECELRRSLHLVLAAAAPDTLRTLCTPGASPPSRSASDTEKVTTSVPLSSSSATDELVHVSSFVHADRGGSRGGGVPSVRTVSLPNPLATSAHAVGCGSEAGATQRILIDLSPLSLLPQCLTSCWHENGYEGATATVAHLRRLARGRHAMLLLIGSHDATTALLNSLSAPELLLDDATHADGDGFQPLPCCPAVRVRLTTSLWGGNVVLRYTPPAASPSTSRDSETYSVIDEVLNLALAWNVDMLSVAVLEATRQAATSATSPTTLPDVVVDTLRQLQYAIARLRASAAGTRFLRAYTIDDTVLRHIVRGEASPKAADLLEPPLAMASRVAGTTEPVRADKNQTTSRRRRSDVATAPSRESSPLGHATMTAFNNTPIAVRLFVPLDADVLRSDRVPDMQAEETTTTTALPDSSQTPPRKGAAAAASAARRPGTSATPASHKAKNSVRRHVVPDEHAVARNNNSSSSASPRQAEQGRIESKARPAAVNTLQDILSRAFGDTIDIL